jgi:hypothetical protein
MDYHRAPPSAMKRKAVVDTEEPVHQSNGHSSPESAHNDYFSPEVRIKRGKTGTVLKKPRIGPNPNVTDPHTVAFADYHDNSYGDHKSVYIDYVRSRQRGHHHAEHLINQIADEHPDHLIEFGKVMNEGIWKVKEDLEARGRKTMGSKFF